MAELVLQHADLGGEGGLGDMQRLGGAGQVAFLGDGPEVVQMVEIQSAHGCSYKVNDWF
ncbi:hypothetical protein Q3H58_000838 [Pseudomonas psychrotolerans]|nr:hypothetical protein [Pseudomonas psychrotolerans]